MFSPLCVDRCPCIGGCSGVGRWLQRRGSVPFLSLLHLHSLDLPQWHNPVAEALSRSALSLSKPKITTTVSHHQLLSWVPSLFSIFYFLFSFLLFYFLFFCCSLIYESSPFYCLPVCGFRDLIFFLGF